MDRYGFLRKSANACEIAYLYETIFPDIASCVRVGSAQEQNSLENTVHYYKILTNKEIIRFIHDHGENELFSYFNMNRQTANKPYAICAASNQLFTHLLDCILIGKCKLTAMAQTTDSTLKIAYYKLLSDDELIKELHQSTVRCQTDFT